MAEVFKLSKKFQGEAGDLVVRALVEDADGKAFHPVTFERSRIDYVTEVSEGVSGIALKTGAKIAVAMPYEQLEREIYFADTAERPVLDLREVTGPAARGAIMPEPAKDFAIAAPAQKTGEDGFPEARPLVDVPLKIGVFARQSGEQNFKMFFFMDEDVDWSNVEGENGRNGPITKLPLEYGDGPFGDDEVIIDMPRAAFMEIYNKAKMEGREELDLRDWTRRRDPDQTPPPPKAKPSPG